MSNSQRLLDIISIQTDIAKLGLDLGAVMALVVERALPLLDAEAAAIELAEGDDMVYSAASGTAAHMVGLRLKMASSLSGLCVRSGEILVCEDSETDPRVDRAACRTIGLRSMIVVPLTHEDSTVGIIKVMSGIPGKFTAEDRDILGMLSELLAASMYYATKYSSDNLLYRATHDSLTELANRSLFMDRLRTAINRGDDGGDFAVAILDMDGLKQINDRFGHRWGDAAIRECARRLKGATRGSDTVARLGGDEFAILLNPLDSPDSVTAIVDRMQRLMAIPYTYEGHTLNLGCSTGTAYYPAEFTNLEQLLQLADQRMYQVKQQRGKAGILLH